MISFFQPVWLLLLVPLAVAWFAWRLPNRFLRILRAATFALVVLAMARLAIRLPDRAGTVVVVADRSESMPKNSASAQKGVIDLLHKSMAPRDLLGVVSFGRNAVIEQSPQRGEFGGFNAQVGAEHSDLNGAIETALSLIPPDGGGRILVLSDGKWTGKDPGAAAARAAGRNVPIDFRLLARPPASDLAIQSFLTPDSVQPGQAYVLSAWVQSPADQQIQFQLRRGDTIIASGSKQVTAGLNRLMFRDRAGAAGISEYELKIEASQEDPIPENNSARALVEVQGSKPLLVVSSAGGNSGLVNLLRRGGVEVVGKSPTRCRWSLEELAQFSGVLIENVSANQIGSSGMETIASWVEDTGSGLMLTGGQKSYGPGGYFKSPLDRILPVSMEMRREHRKMSLAISIAMDRSGSMQLPAGGGRRKMDLADMGAAQVLDLLSPMDEISVFAVDTSAHEIVPMDSVEKNAAYRSKILSIDSMGGGIFIYEALVAAAKSVSTAASETKHIILFADAADSEQPGNYKELVAKCRDGGITISVVGMGTERDVDANLLKDIAERGGGTCYFSDSPDEIPRLFAQDTFTVARSTFVNEETPFETTAGFSLLGSPLNAKPAALGGYNLCYIKPEANLAAVTGDEYKAPVVSSWNAGNGRVLCFAGEADGKFSGPLAQWTDVGEFYATLARWTAGKHQPLPDDELLVQQVRDGICYVQLHLDPQRKADPFAALPKIKILHGLPGTPPAKETQSLQWKTADLLEAAIPITGRETVLNTAEIPGQQPVALAPVCLPYSPEFAPEQPGRGAAALEKIAQTSGGKERIEIPQIWSELQIKPRYIELTPWLLVLATILFLLEILERRTGWVSKMFARRAAETAPAVEEIETAEPVIQTSAFGKVFAKKKRVISSNGKKSEQRKTKISSAPAIQSGQSAAETSNLDAFRKARERADRRTGGTKDN
jgi:Mg-chelatase subunit ChlD